MAHDGQWRAGVAGAILGIFIPEPWRSLGEATTVPLGTFANTVRFLETTPLEPGVTSTQVYASGVGQIVDDVVRLVSRTS